MFLDIGWTSLGWSRVLYKHIIFMATNFGLVQLGSSLTQSTRAELYTMKLQ